MPHPFTPHELPGRTEKHDVGMPRATLTPLASKACICTKLIHVEPPVFAILMAETGTQDGEGVAELRDLVAVAVRVFVAVTVAERVFVVDIVLDIVAAAVNEGERKASSSASASVADRRSICSGRACARETRERMQ